MVRRGTWRGLPSHAAANADADLRGTVEGCVGAAARTRAVCTLATAASTLLLALRSDRSVASVPLEANGVLVRVTALVADDAFNMAVAAYHDAGAAGLGSSLAVLRLWPLALLSLSEAWSGPNRLVAGLSVDSARRVLQLAVESDAAVTFVARNLFGMTSVAPTVVDAGGVLSVTLAGAGFPTQGSVFDASPPSCAVSGAEGTATVLNATHVVCSVGPVGNASAASSCGSQLLSVAFNGTRRTATTYVGLLRPGSAALRRAGSGRASGVVAAGAPATVWLEGTGFFAGATSASCRVTSATGSAVLGTSTSVTVHSSLAAECALPAMCAVPGGSVVHFSQDGATYGAVGAALNVVGPLGGVAAEPAQVVVRADAVAAAPVFTVRTTDALGNARGLLEPDDALTVRCSSVEPAAAASGASEVVAFADGAVLRVRVRNGTAVFDRVLLLAPAVGAVTLHCFVTVSLNLAARVTLAVVAGDAVRLAALVDAGAYRVAVAAERALEPDVVVAAVDGAGNRVTGGALPVAVLRTTVVRDGGAAGFGLVPVAYSAGPDRDGTYRFRGVSARTYFGREVLVTVEAPGLLGASLELAPELCATSLRAVAGTTRCVACPDHAVCDGSPLIAAPPGYWLQMATAPGVARCEVPSACAGNERCGGGYAGLACTQCAAGYGHTGPQCMSCLDEGSSIALIVLACVGAVVVVAYLSIGSMRALDAEQYHKLGAAEMEQRGRRCRS